MEIRIENGEYWYGGAAADGVSQPFTRGSGYARDLIVDTSCNQAAPLYLSSHGRYLWSEAGFSICERDGILCVTQGSAPVELADGFGTLRGAYRAACAAHFPPSGQCPPALFFTAPQYNTWIELTTNQNQKQILEYAHGILLHGLPAGILMIDDGWAPYNGALRFDGTRFSSARVMVEELHALGFRVMLWETPFISPDTNEFRELKEKGCLLLDAAGVPAVREWWNGYSAVLDMTNPAAVTWLAAKNESLMKTYGVDGFKMDAGDALYYREDDRPFLPITPNGQSERWAQFGLRYDYNEYRACFKCGGQPLVQRLGDKAHSWGKNGLASLIPNQLTQGLLGYAFTCPDMIGGGEIGSFRERGEALDAELFVRYAQCAALMPMMQFSAAPWRVLDNEHAALCTDAARLHEEMAHRIQKLAKEAAVTGEPIVRHMEYVFPHQGFADIVNQFMLGDSILVAPVLEKGQRERNVHFPAGVWKDRERRSYEGGTVHCVEAPLNRLPVFWLAEEAEI